MAQVTATVEGAIFFQLTSHPGWSALAGTRAYPVELPQGAALPATVYQLISDPPLGLSHTSNGLVRARFQLASIAGDHDWDAAKALDAQVHAALRGWTCWLADDQGRTVDVQACTPAGGGGDRPDPVPGRARRMSDFWITYVETTP